MRRLVLILILAAGFAGLFLLLTRAGARRSRGMSADRSMVDAAREPDATGVRSVPVDLTPRPGLEGLAIPDFALTRQDNAPVDQSTFDGRITIVSFIFTHCTLACPNMTGGMNRVAMSLKDSSVRFVSITVDPAHDTPERLTAYAANWGIDTSRWSFLTGDEATVRRIVTDSLKFDISADTDGANTITLEDGSTMQNILHPTKLFLIGPRRELLDFYDPRDTADLERLIARARSAAALVGG